MDFGVLGSLSVTTGGRTLALGGPVQRRLLAALVAHAPQPVASDTLVDDVWGESAPATAVRTLHSHVARLRDALGRDSAHQIETVDGRYRLPLERADLDAWVFEDLVLAATSNGHDQLETAQLLRRALALWRGPAYGDFLGVPFADAEGRRLEALRDHAIEAAIDAELADGKGAQLVPELEALVITHPFREKLWADLVIALYRAGRQADALDAYQRARAVLGDELGVDPGPELKAVEAKVLMHDPTLLVATPSAVRTCPWKGLSAYETADADFFVGRDGLVNEVVARLVDYSVVIVTGPSGSGKSSLLRAGVIPALSAGAIIGSAEWRIELVSPGNQPLEAIRATLRRHPNLLVIDPGDDLLVGGSAGDVALISDELRPAIAGGLRVVMSLRGDLFGRLTELKSLAPRAAAGTVLVGVPREDELRSVVEVPARHVGLDVEPALVEAVLADVGGRPASLPLLSTALVRTWERREGNRLTLAGYTAAGGTASALERLAEEAYESMDDGERAAARRILLRLVVNDDGFWRRRRVARDEVAPVSDASATRALDCLSDHRLVSVDVGDLQLSHEALTGAWPRFARWLDEREMTAGLVDHLTAATHTWVEGGREDADLYRGARLQAALDLQATQPDELGPIEREFVASGRAAADRELARLRRGRRRLGYVAAALVVLLALSSVAVVLAVHSRDDAAKAALEADAQRLGLQAQTRTDFSQKLLLAVAAVGLHDNAGTQASLLSALQGAGGASMTVPLRSMAERIAVAQDGWTGVAEDGGTVETFDETLAASHVADPQASWTAGTPTGAVSWLTGHTSMLVGASDPDRVFSLNPQNSGVSVAASGWSPTVFAGTGDGDWLVGMPADPSATSTLLARRVDGGADDVEVRLSGVPTSIVSGPGSTVTVIESGAVERIDVSQGRVLSTATVPSPGRTAVSADGRTAATALPDGAVEVTDLLTGSTTHPVRQADGPVSRLALSDDGSLLAGTVAREGDIHVWSTSTGLERARFTSTLGDVAAMAWASGDRLLTASATIPALQAWDLTRYASPATPVLATAPAGAGATTATALDPTTRTLAVATDLGRPWFVDLDSGRATVSSGPPGAPLVSVSFADHGRLALTADSIGVLTVWDVATGSRVGDLTGATSVDSLTAVARAPVGPDGRTAASFTDGFGLRLIDVVAQTIGDPVYPDLGPQLEFEVLGWSPDGRQVVVAAQGMALNARKASSPGVWALIDPKDGTVVWLTDAPEQIVAADVVYADNGRAIIVPGKSGRLYFLDAGTGAVIDFGGATSVRPLVVNDRQTPASISLSPDGRQMSVVSAAHPAEIWDVTSGVQVGTIKVPVGTSSAHFVTDEKWVSTTTDGAVTLHDLNVSDWITLACRAAGRELTALEWQQFLPTHPYRSVCADASSAKEAS